MKRTVCAGNVRIEYILIQSNRQGILLQALPEGATRVYAPKGMRLRDIDETVRGNVQKILDMHARLDKRLDEERLAHPVSEGSRIAVEGDLYPLRLHAGRVRGEVKADGLHLWLPEPHSEDRVRAALKHALAERALERIRERIAHYHPLIGGSFGRVTVRDQRSRWGSCSSKNNLNFNWKLIMAPQEALDYVVIHELCHLHEFNHSPRFWNLVASQMPEYEIWKKWLKVHGEELGV